jgi:ABC-type uncharacterized transport system substrate-binding protein
METMRKSVSTILALLVLASPAAAHPHVWVDMESSLIVNAKGLVEALSIEWTFDDNYAQTALEGLDTDGDGAYSKAELDPLTKENITSMKEYDYFTAFRQGAGKLPLNDVTEYGQIYADGRLKLFFKVPLKEPADPKTGELMIKVYDPDFFIAFDYVKDAPVSLDGTLPPGCTMELKPLKTDAETDQTLAMLSEKGPDWKPETEEDFGALFAQPLVVACAS